MNSLVTKVIGTVKSGTPIDTGLLATVADDYIFEVFQGGTQTNVTVPLGVGDDIELPNTFNESTTIQFRVKLPASAQTTEHSYATTPLGQIIFEFTNLL